MGMYLGIDLGTSGVKTLLIDASQRIIASATSPLEVFRPQPGWSEQEPSNWISAAQTALAELAASQDLSQVTGIGLSGQMHGATLLDAADQPLRPCILWNDTRSHLEAEEMDAQPEFRRLTGNIVFPGFTAPKLAWVRKHEPHIFEQTAKVLLPKDYLRLWLTGEHVSEMSDAAGTSWLDVRERRWSGALLSATGLTEGHMPHLVEGSEISAKIRPEIAALTGLPAGTPVAGGAGDNAASAVGVGVSRAGEGFVSLGTSGVLFAATDSYAPDAKSALHTFCHALPDRWHQMGVILAATDALNWLASLLGKEAASLTDELTELHAPGRAMFLPYLGGERTPHNDAKIRGALLGIEHQTDHQAATRAVLEGVSFAIRDSLSAMQSTGTALDHLVAVGGGAKSEYWLRALATVLDKPIAVPKDGDFGAAFGAARLGMMASGAGGADLASPPEIERVIEPDNSLSAAFDDAYARYNSTYSAIKDLS